MSNRILNWVLANGPDHPVEMHVPPVLADRADENGRCWPSVADICARNSRSERGV